MKPKTGCSVLALKSTFAKWHDNKDRLK